jgi:hypothetical protein
MYGLGLGLGLGLVNRKSQASAPEGTILGGLYDDADSFFAATVSPGAVTITGALFSDADTFFGATVSAGGGVMFVPTYHYLGF